MGDAPEMTDQEIGRLQQAAWDHLRAVRALLASSGASENALRLAIEVLVLRGWRPPADTTATEGESDAG